MVDSDGNPIEGEQFGLLLYRGGTVCDDGFNNTAAEAICKHVNSSYTTFKWTSGRTSEIQHNLMIKLDEVQCSSADWESCKYSIENDCGHDEDVYLFCASPLSGTIDCLQKRM